MPAGALAYDYKKSGKDLSDLLKGHIGIAEVRSQKVVLKALLYDGTAAYPIWTGCPAEYGDTHGFKIDGVTEASTSYNVTAKDGKPLLPMGGSFDPRCLTSAKCMKKPSAACPYCAMGRGTTKPISGTVSLTLPVYQPDPTRPFMKSGKVMGYHSKYVGDVTFDKVPVTLSGSIGMYERRFGLLNNFGNGSWVLGFGFWVLGVVGCWVLGVRILVLGVGLDPTGQTCRTCRTKGSLKPKT